MQNQTHGGMVAIAEGNLAGDSPIRVRISRVGAETSRVPHTGAHRRISELREADAIPARRTRFLRPGGPW